MPKLKTTDAVYNKALNDAIKSIYKVYGPDLSAFFRAVQNQPLKDGDEETQFCDSVPRVRRNRKATR